MSDDTRPDWDERLVKLAGALGFNEQRLRWRLMRRREQRQTAAEHRKVRIAHVAYAHAVCPECGRVQPRGTGACSGCGAVMPTHAMQVLSRVGLISPVQLSASLVVGLMILACYGRQVAFAGGTFSQFEGLTLLQLGAHYPPLEWAGQAWRLGTAMFLHAGLMHVAFNLIALVQVGPRIEELFGRGRALAFYMATGLIGFVPSMLLHQNSMSVGASGALFGFIGVGAGWGHRDGTTQGRAVRNSMILWLVIATVVGSMLRADHLAHFSGFVSGALIGLLVPSRQMGGRSVRVDFALGLAAAIVGLVFVALVFIAPGRELG